MVNKNDAGLILNPIAVHDRHLQMKKKNNGVAHDNPLHPLLLLRKLDVVENGVDDHGGPHHDDRVLAVHQPVHGLDHEVTLHYLDQLLPYPRVHLLLDYVFNYFQVDVDFKVPLSYFLDVVLYSAGEAGRGEDLHHVLEENPVLELIEK